MFRRLRRMKGNKLAFDDDTAKEVAAWLATYAHHCDTAAARSLRAMMTTGEKSTAGQHAYWKHAASAIRWLITMIRVPVGANDLAIAYLRQCERVQRAIKEGDRGQLAIPFGATNVNSATPEGEGGILDTRDDPPAIERGGSGTVRSATSEDHGSATTKGQSKDSGRTVRRKTTD